MISLSDERTRVYLYEGITTHLLASWESPNEGAASLCGAKPGEDEFWYGTGTQDEWDLAELLPTCLECRMHDDSVSEIVNELTH